MVTAFLIAGAVLQGQGAAPAPQDSSGGAIALVSKMLAHYANAKTASGRIRYTVVSGNESASIETAVQYDRPVKRLFIRQSKSIGGADTRFVTSDGKQFSYDIPGDGSFRKATRLLEYTKELRSDKTIRDFDLGDIYQASAGGLLDRSAVLDIAIGRTDDLRFLRGQWKTVQLQGKVQLDGKEVNRISGEWREYGAGPVLGTYEMFVTDEGDLVRYVRHENTIPPGESNPIAVDAIWESNIAVNGAVDDTLFKVIR